MNPKETRLIKYPSGTDPFPFQLSLYLQQGSTTEGYSVRQFRFFSQFRGRRELKIEENGEVFFESDHTEKSFDYYSLNLQRSNFWRLTDSMISGNTNSEVSAEIILTQLCRANYPAETIQTYYNKLTDSIRNSISGKIVAAYLRARNQMKEGSLVGNFVLKDSSGKSIQLGEISSDYILLDFWFSSCKPCIESFPSLINLYKGYSRTKFEIIGLSVDREKLKPQWKKAILKNQLPWINLLDSESAVSYRTFSLENSPTQILLARQRSIVKVNPTNEEFKQLCTGGE